MDTRQRRKRLQEQDVENNLIGRQEQQPRRSRRRRRRQQHKQPRGDVPFWWLFVQVGVVVLVVGVVCLGTYRWVFGIQQVDDDDDNVVADDLAVTEFIQQQQQQAAAAQEELEKNNETTSTTTTIVLPPSLVLSKYAQRYDAYALSAQYPNPVYNTEFWQEEQLLRQEFSRRYGGDTAARWLVDQGLSIHLDENENDKDDETKTVPSSLMETACRIQRAQSNESSNSTFRFAFGGYSVTAGRGNYFSQSFPFVMDRVLKGAFATMGIQLEVRNAAIGGVPSFPYGWCLDNFWGLGGGGDSHHNNEHVDVVSWDYSMNEAGGIPQGLEAYIRQILWNAPTTNRQQERRPPPKLLVKDTHMATARRDLLFQSSYRELLGDAIVLHTDPAVEPFWKIPEHQRPMGLRDWRKFGAPPGAPGQALHHPAKKEHELMGWILAMHFLSALQIVALSQEKNDIQLSCPLDTSTTKDDDKSLIPPVTTTKQEDKTLSSLLFGYPQKEEKGWRMNRIHCRTSFEPVLWGRLDEIVVGGTAPVDQDHPLMPKGAMYYNQGWVLDWSESERLAKRQLDRYGGLGFVDSKKAYYGIYTSKSLRLFLPLNVQPTTATTTLVRDVLQSIVVCQVNEKQRLVDACQPDRQIQYTVGGVVVPNGTSYFMDNPGTLYLGHKLCVQVAIPANATLDSGNQEEQQMGVSLELRVSDRHIMKKEKACSVSHVVWEEKTGTAAAARQD